MNIFNEIIVKGTDIIKIIRVKVVWRKTNEQKLTTTGWREGGSGITTGDIPQLITSVRLKKKGNKLQDEYHDDSSGTTK